MLPRTKIGWPKLKQLMVNMETQKKEPCRKRNGKEVSFDFKLFVMTKSKTDKFLRITHQRSTTYQEVKLLIG